MAPRELRPRAEIRFDHGDLLRRRLRLEVDVDARLSLPLLDCPLEVLRHEHEDAEDQERDRDHGDGDEARTLRCPDSPERFPKEVGESVGGNFGLVEVTEFASHQEVAMPNRLSLRFAGFSGSGTFSSMILPRSSVMTLRPALRINSRSCVARRTVEPRRWA